MRDERAYFYDTIADSFDAIDNPYDTGRRVEIVFDELLGDVDLRGRTLLDVGCGFGAFSGQAVARGARVTSLDIGLQLLGRTRQQCGSRPVNADACRLPFADASFDVVISSECIEHTLDPAAALREISRVARPGGLIVVTTPNHLWHFAVTIAEALRLRPYHGYENWLRWDEVRDTLGRSGASIDQLRGFHLVPPIWRFLWPWLRRLDRFGGTVGPLMLNIAVKARK